MIAQQLGERPAILHVDVALNAVDDELDCGVRSGRRFRLCTRRQACVPPIQLWQRSTSGNDDTGRSALDEFATRDLAHRILRFRITSDFSAWILAPAEP